jgi:hypothetical protein
MIERVSVADALPVPTKGAFPLAVFSVVLRSTWGCQTSIILIVWLSSKTAPNSDSRIIGNTVKYTTFTEPVGMRTLCLVGWHRTVLCCLSSSPTFSHLRTRHLWQLCCVIESCSSSQLGQDRGPVCLPLPEAQFHGVSLASTAAFETDDFALTTTA